MKPAVRIHQKLLNPDAQQNRVRRAGVVKVFIQYPDVMEVYLDHAATTPLDPRVFEAMKPAMAAEYGNASSVHAPGRRARVLVEQAREHIATMLSASPSEIVFTSGGTESNNLALSWAHTNCALVTTAVEHEAVLKPAERLAQKGHRVVILPVDDEGRLSEDTLDNALRAIGGVPVLVSVMHVNNETGAINPVAALTETAHRHGAVFHTDAVQSADLFELDVDDLGVDLLSISAHKIYGPKGAGLLYARAGTDLTGFVIGGAQERGRRGGTENVAGILGLAAAMQLAAQERQATRIFVQSLRCHLLDGLSSVLGSSFKDNSSFATDTQAQHILNVSFPRYDGRRIDGEMLILGLDIEGVYVSSGSACTSGTLTPSHVLLAMGRDLDTARAAVRFSIGRSNTESDIEYAVAAVEKVVKRIRTTNRVEAC